MIAFVFLAFENAQTRTALNDCGVYLLMRSTGEGGQGGEARGRKKW